MTVASRNFESSSFFDDSLIYAVNFLAFIDRRIKFLLLPMKIFVLFHDNDSFGFWELAVVTI